MTRVVVLGIGNILLSDEGVGVHAVAELERRYRLPETVTVVDGGTTGMELLDYVAGVDHLVVVDAVNAGAGPGSIIRLAGDEVPALFRTRISPHQLGLSDLLAALQLRGESPGSITLLGVQPAVLDTGIGLSPVVAARLDAVVEHLCAELRALGQAPVLREAA